MAFDNLEWKIIAHDEASKVVEKITEANKDLAKELQKTSAEAKKGEGSWKDMAKGIFAGVASYDALKSSIGVVTGFFKGSINESIKAGAEMANIKQNVENAGFAFEDIKNKLKGYGDSMVDMGFAGGETSDSVSRLMLITKDYDKALQLNKLSMDLARNKNIDLASATNIVTQVTQGNTKVLKQYGIELSDTASAADNLRSLQDKLKGSAEAYGKTTAGQLSKMKTQWEDVKQAVGDELAPVMGQFMAQVSENMPAITSAIVSFASAIAKAGSLIVEMTKAWSLFTGQDMNKVEKGLTQNLDVVAERFNKSMGKAGRAVRITGEELAKMDTAISRSIIQQFGKGAVQEADNLQKKMDEASLNFKGIGASMSDGAKAAAASIKTEFGKIKETYQDAVNKVSESLAKMDEEHRTRVESITKKIADLKKQIKELNDEFSRSSGDLNKSEAEKVVDQEQKIADLKKQISGTTDGAQAADLQAQLQKEEAAYSAYIQNRKGLESELSEARRRGQLTEFEKFIEDTNSRRTALEEDHKKKMELLQIELVEQENTAAQEQIIYQAKREQYIQTQQAFQVFHDQYLLKLGSMRTGTQKMVDEMNGKLKEMMNIIGQIETAKNRAGIVGAAGFDKTDAAAATPAQVSTNAGGQSITVNLGGVSVNNKGDADYLVQKIVRQLQLSQVGSQ